MRKIFFNRIPAVLLSILIFAFALPLTAVAETDATMTLICKRADTILSGMNWDIYYIGQRCENTYTLEGSFADYPVSIDVSSTQSMVNAAVTLENYAVIDNIPYTHSGYIDEYGYLTFSGLKSGLYLVSGHIFNVDVVFYQPSPVLVEIDLEAEDPDIDLIVYPKIKYALLSEVNLNNSVKKNWFDTKQSHDPIEVEIYKNGDIFDTVTLSEDNDWAHSWKATEYAQWRVKEKVVPKDYTVNYYSDNGKFVIENTSFVSEPPPTETTTELPPEITTETLTEITTTTTVSPPPLPQTGQLWWPVIVMGSVGAVLIVVGIRLKIKKSE